MKTTVHWLGGWASSLICWEEILRETFPEFEHRFLETHALLDQKPAQARLTGLPSHHVVAAWSMGTLLAHHWMAQGLWPKELPLLSLNPVFQFLRPGGFGEPILLRMEKKLETDRDAVLRDFWRRMPKAGEIPPQWEEQWLAGTRGYSNAELIHGLEFLRNTVVDPHSLSSVPSRWELLAGSGDLLATPIPDGGAPPNALYLQYVGGHLPFWECPDIIRASLNRLVLP